MAELQSTPSSEKQEFLMSQDPRCCGTGTCIIDTEGRCWCGQQWDGRQMSHALPASAAPVPPTPQLFPADDKTPQSPRSGAVDTR
jgi:hypothetical protein